MCGKSFDEFSQRFVWDIAYKFEGHLSSCGRLPIPFFHWLIYYNIYFMNWHNKYIWSLSGFWQSWNHWNFLSDKSAFYFKRIPFWAHLNLSWASLLAQRVKNPPAMLETWVWSLCWEDPLEEGSPLQYSRLENPHGQRSLAGCHGVAKSRTQLSKKLSTYLC